MGCQKESTPAVRSHGEGGVCRQSEVWLGMNSKANVMEKEHYIVFDWSVHTAAETEKLFFFGILNAKHERWVEHSLLAGTSPRGMSCPDIKIDVFVTVQGVVLVVHYESQLVGWSRNILQPEYKEGKSMVRWLTENCKIVASTHIYKPNILT